MLLGIVVVLGIGFLLQLAFASVADALFIMANLPLALIGAVVLAALMVCALATHVKRGTPAGARLPAVTLFILSVFIALTNGGLLGP